MTMNDRPKISPKTESDLQYDGALEVIDKQRQELEQTKAALEAANRACAEKDHIIDHLESLFGYSVNFPKFDINHSRSKGCGLGYKSPAEWSALQDKVAALEQANATMREALIPLATVFDKSACTPPHNATVSLLVRVSEILKAKEALSTPNPAAWVRKEKLNSKAPSGQHMVSWAILYEDPDHKAELFTDEIAARNVFGERKLSWSCHLFCLADQLAAANEDYEASLALIRKQTEQIAAITAERDRAADECEHWVQKAARFTQERDAAKARAVEAEAALATSGGPGYRPNKQALAELLSEPLEFLGELKGAWDWKKDEPRAGNKAQYDALCKCIDRLRAVLGVKP